MSSGQFAAQFGGPLLPQRPEQHLAGRESRNIFHDQHGPPAFAVSFQQESSQAQTQFLLGLAVVGEGQIEQDGLEEFFTAGEVAVGEKSPGGPLAEALAKLRGEI